MRIEIPTWILCRSHDKFEFTLSPIFESKPDSNPDSIFLWVPVFTVAGPTLFFSPVFSLSPPLLLCLSLSPLGHYRYGLPLPDYLSSLISPKSTARWNPHPSNPNPDLQIQNPKKERSGRAERGAGLREKERKKKKKNKEELWGRQELSDLLI